MGESGGHFDKGRWVEETEQENQPETDQVEIEERLKTAAGKVGKGIDEIIEIGSDLLTSPEGRQQLGKKLDKVTGELITTLEDIRREGVDFINRARDRIIK